MKPYNALTHLGRLQRMRQLADIALKEYGLSGATLKFYPWHAADAQLCAAALGKMAVAPQ